MKISKEVKEKLKNELLKEIQSAIDSRKIKVDKSQIDDIVKIIESRIKIPEQKLDSSGIISGLLDNITTTEDQKRTDFYRDEIFSTEVKSALSKQVLDQIELPKDGDKGESGDKGDPGKDAPPVELTERDKKEIAEFVDITKLIKDRKQDLVKLVEQLKNGKIKIKSGAGIDTKEIIAEITKILGHSNWTDRGLAISNDGVEIAVRPDENYTTDDNLDVTSTDNPTEDRTDTVISISDNPNFDSILLSKDISEPEHLEGRVWYDKVTKGHVLDSGYDNVRLNTGRERHIEVYNDTGSLISNGDPVSTFEDANITITGILPNIVPSDSSSILSVLSFAGVAAMDIPDSTSGLVTVRGRVSDINTGLLSVGFIYADNAGWYTQTRPIHPYQRLLVGVVIKTGTTDGIIYVESQIVQRRNASRSFGFTSQGIGAGTFYKGGFYDWSATSTTLTESSLTQTHGTVGRSYAAHVGVVPSGPGTVDAGQVGLRVIGIQDSETGAQTAAQIGIITEDITSLTVNVMAECQEKFSGQVSIDLYIVSGTPTAYSLAFNYGYSKYEDISNQNVTVTTVECVWLGSAADSGFDIALKHHTALGWTYAASGFNPGNGDIARKSIDQSLAGNVVDNENGAWKRSGLNFFIEGSGNDGILFEIITTAPNTIQTMDINISGFSEDLS